MDVTTIGIDLAKHVFQVHAVDAAGKVIVRKALRRAQVLPFFTKLSPCLVGMEACGTSHHWARELVALGHTVKMMPPAYVKAYVKRGKTDAADAEAICEAVTRPTMRFVPVKSREQQAALSMHRARNLLVKQRTQSVNMMRGLLAEFGINIPEGLERALTMARQVLEGEAPDVPAAAVKIIFALSQQSLDTHSHVREIDRALAALQRSDEMVRRLATIPGIGPIGATALAASVTDPGQFLLGPTVRGLARSDPVAELERRQGTARTDQQNGRQISTQAARDWRHCVGSICQEQARNRSPPLGQSVGQKARAGSDRCDGQQDGADRLGGYDARRSLPARPRAGTVGIAGRTKFS